MDKNKLGKDFNDLADKLKEEYESIKFHLKQEVLDLEHKRITTNEQVDRAFKEKLALMNDIKELSEKRVAFGIIMKDLDTKKLELEKENKRIANFISIEKVDITNERKTLQKEQELLDKNKKDNEYKAERLKEEQKTLDENNKRLQVELNILSDEKLIVLSEQEGNQKVVDQTLLEGVRLVKEREVFEYHKYIVYAQEKKNKEKESSLKSKEEKFKEKHQEQDKHSIELLRAGQSLDDERIKVSVLVKQEEDQIEILKKQVISNSKEKQSMEYERKELQIRKLRVDRLIRENNINKELADLEKDT